MIKKKFLTDYFVRQRRYPNEQKCTNKRVGDNVYDTPQCIGLCSVEGG